MIWSRSMKCSSSFIVLVKCILVATTGSSQPLIMVHIPGGKGFFLSSGSR